MRVAEPRALACPSTRIVARAELEARREEIETLRAVVAALRGVAATRREREKDTRRGVTSLNFVTAAAIGVLIGFTLALALAEWLHR